MARRHPAVLLVPILAMLMAAGFLLASCASDEDEEAPRAAGAPRAAQGVITGVVTAPAQTIPYTVTLNVPDVTVTVTQPGTTTQSPATTTTPTTTTPTTTTPTEPVGETVIRNRQGYTCDRRVDLALLRITDPPGQALSLAPGCTGIIRRIEISGVGPGDGIKVQNPGSTPAHDLQITGGFVRCDERQDSGGVHQDGLQAMGGTDILFVNVVFDCMGGGGGNFFINRAVSSHTPTGIVCDHCAFGPRHGPRSHNVNIARSIASGVKNSLVCQPEGSGRPINIQSSAEFPINENNIIAPRGDPRCTVDGLLEWVGG